MKYLKNERGNSVFYLIGILSFIAILLLILTNMAKAFATGAHASNVAEQAAYAATAVIIQKTKEAVAQYDAWVLAELDLEEGEIEFDPVTEAIEDKRDEYLALGDNETQAYIKALNEVLPGEINSRARLKDFIRSNINASDLHDAVWQVFRQNGQGSIETDYEFEYLETAVAISNVEWRIVASSEIKMDLVADGDIITSGEEGIEVEGKGPILNYLEDVYN